MPKNDQGLNAQDENARLKALLARHGIPWEELTTPETVPATPEPALVPSQFTTDGKIALFRLLFREREGVYPQRWESAKVLTSYSPAFGNEWKPGVCHKPKETQFKD